MGKFFEILDVGIASVNKTVAVLGIAAGTLLAFINVVMRYCFNTGWSWAGELTNYLFIWSAFFAAAYGFRKGIHISVTIFDREISRSYRQGLSHLRKCHNDGVFDVRRGL